MTEKLMEADRKLHEELLVAKRNAEEESQNRRALMGCMTYFVGVVPSMIFQAFVLMCLFGWFGEPLVRIHLGIWSAMGLRLMVAAVTGYRQPREPTEEDRRLAKESPVWLWMRGLIMPVLYSGFLLLFGYILHSAT